MKKNQSSSVKMKASNQRNQSAMKRNEATMKRLEELYQVSLAHQLEDTSKAKKATEAFVA
jgi:hypothetical protein